MVIPGLCYLLFLLAWGIDLVTPQLFVAAVLLNGPIALSSLALRPRLTIQLIVLAELANIVAGYVNGVQAGGHWDAIALGDRALSGATFLLVGFLTMRALEYARSAGEATERERQIRSERALRHAMESVRASLNMELVLRSAVREAMALTHANRVTIAVRASSFDVPDLYEMREGDSEVSVRRASLRPEYTSLIERARESGRVATVDASEPLGRLLGEATLVASLDVENADTSLILTWAAQTPSADERAAIQDFIDNLGVALGQARLFIQLADQNDEIARQKDTLQARNDVIRDIVYALAHDLRTPLVAADVTMSQALAGAFGDLPDRYLDVLRSNLASNVDLRRLVETLLLVARYESGEDSRAFDTVDVDLLLRRVIDEMAPIASVRGVELSRSGNAVDVSVLVDGDELRRAVTNLVANAIEATPAGGHVRVDARKEGGMLAVDVVDDGFGVPMERRGSLFQRFAGARGRGAGTGLGLYIVKRIAEKYQGRATYEPREPQGSIFRMEIPL